MLPDIILDNVELFLLRLIDTSVEDVKVKRLKILRNRFDEPKDMPVGSCAEDIVWKNSMAAENTRGKGTFVRVKSV